MVQYTGRYAKPATTAAQPKNQGAPEEGGDGATVCKGTGGTGVLKGEVH